VKKPYRSISGISRNAEFLLYLLVDRHTCEALVGDLDEHYQLVFRKFGRRRADVWMWLQIIATISALGKDKAGTLFRRTIRKQSGRGVSVPAPPINAKFLFFLFLDAKNCDATVGDLEERYRIVQREFGRLRANLWYWKEALHSVGPIVVTWARKKAMKSVAAVAAWALAKGLIGHDGWLAVLVEWLKKVRS